MEARTLTAGPAAAGQRLDRWLAAACDDLSRSALQSLMEEGRVTVDGRPANKKNKLRGGETITLTLPDPQPIEAQPQNIPLEIVYEDAHLLVVNKPKGMVVHPAAGNEDGTLVNALLYHCGDSLSGINGVIRPGIVHRIDKDTSGLLIVAKNDAAHRSLAEQIKAHSFTREYRAVVYGRIKADGTVDAPIARHPQERKRMAVVRSPAAREAVTHYFVVRHFTGFTQLRLRLETGRTHQIRVHSSYIHHPVTGDAVYGGSTSLFKDGQLLHAARLELNDPSTGERKVFECPLPDDFAAVLDRLRKTKK